MNENDLDRADKVISARYLVMQTHGFSSTVASAIAELQVDCFSKDETEGATREAPAHPRKVRQLLSYAWEVASGETALVGEEAIAAEIGSVKQQILKELGL